MMKTWIKGVIGNQTLIGGGGRKLVIATKLFNNSGNVERIN